MQKDTMIRKQLYITRAQDRAIKERAKREGLRESEVVREAIDRHLSQQTPALSLRKRKEMDDLMRRLRELSENVHFEPGYRFNREELYAERENRWVKNRVDE